ncbi:hypothetical protein SCUCBS95973_000747 [Sporothrix curviconia]|uniref:Meiosis-specific APC/C activator protein AMA1 n=1 Tax=Sporothrix curviconia TaxID=1260050 RepID=A0ABP0ASW7_9PEZI
MDIPSAFTNPLPVLPIRTRTPDNDNETLPDFDNSPPRTPGISSLDSGYGSAEPTPVKPPAELEDSFDYCGSYTLDGSVADSTEHHSMIGIDECPRSALFTPEQKFLGLAASSLKQGRIKLPPVTKAASLQRPHKARVGLASSFYSTASPQPSCRCGPDSLSSCLPSSSPSAGSIRVPDRFVHPRDADDTEIPLGEKFRLTKTPHELEDVEKVLRNNHISVDDFFDSTARVIPVSTFANDRQSARQRRGWPTQTRIRTTLLPGQMGDVPESEFDQRLMRGSVWSIGTVPPIVGAVNNGNGSMTQTGTAAPYYTSSFVNNFVYPSTDIDKHRGRIAAALDVDRASRLLQCNINKGVLKLHPGHTFPVPVPNAAAKHLPQPKKAKTVWDGARWVKDGARKMVKAKEDDPDEYRPLRILSGPNYRDDFYCSLLAYCPTTDTVAVGLADLLYTWSEGDGAVHINGSNNSDVWLTCLAFSSEEGGRGILAFGRSNNVFGLMAIDEANNARMLVEEASSISCLSWRPTCTMRPSKNPSRPGRLVSTEDLLVGTEAGLVLYYVIEWPDLEEVEKDRWQGDVTLVARISVHSQLVYGISWAPDGESFATGANDNNCCFFYTNDVLPRAFRPGGTGQVSDGQPRRTMHSDLANSLRVRLSNGRQVRERVKTDLFVRQMNSGTETWLWEHGAAVKAIAFCPWQDGLVATGGGSNDRCIHFFHTTSGSTLATIFVSAQVTSLIWSTTRREIAATFGFTHPNHPIRVAVYSWPDCKQVAAIPWDGKHRALYGISCSRSRRQCLLGAKSDDADKSPPRTLKDGCIAVASSEANVKFYELWPSDNKPITTGVGMLGGSDILEDMEGIQKEGDIIR